MKSKVYFIKIEQSDPVSAVQEKLSRLLIASDILKVASSNDRVAIKLHFGEEGNTGFVKPEYVRIIVDGILQRQASCFLCDTNTLYQGRRLNSSGHLALAYEHGFTKAIAGCEVIIPDDTQKENREDVELGLGFIKVARIAKIFSDADALVGIAHFKGHIMTGFGGALKNLGMGCATREGKLAQHADVAPLALKQKCTGCGGCVAACPVRAISLEKKKAVISSSLCIGCASCIAVCPKSAIEVSWESGGSSIQQKMVEYAKAVLKNKEEKSVFINFATKITKECDCLAKDDPRIAPDVGICVSSDPVSIDKACFDLINQACGKDIFRQAHPERNPLKQLEHAQDIGIGSQEYELITV